MKKIACISLLLVVGVISVCLLGGCKKEDADKNDEYEPTSSLEMSEGEAAALGEKVKCILYFTSADGKSLAAETQLAEFTPKDRRTENLAKKVCELLLAGPQDTALKNQIPQDTVVKSVHIDGGKATVDFSEAFLSKLPANADEINLIVYAVVNSLTEIKDINEVAITVEGKSPGKMECGFEFNVFQRNAGLISSAVETVATAEDYYTEENFADVQLE